MEDEGSGFGGVVGWVIGFGIVIWILGGLFGSSKYEGQTAEEWYNEYDQCEVNVTTYKTTIEEANTKIEEANSNIDNANSKVSDAKQSSRWDDDYEELQDKINNLEEIDNIDSIEEPY